MTAVLSSTYFGPVQWFQKLNIHKPCLIERCESFIKQTYRNRCTIATEAGLQVLSVPVEHGTQHIRDVRISDHGAWRHLHWNAIMSAYGESPFFEFYADDIRPFFERRWEFLFDFDMEITLKMCELLDIHPEIKFTEEFVSDYSVKGNGKDSGGLTVCTDEPIADFRNSINPKHPMEDTAFTPTPYYQVYAQRHGFLPNLSILDLLFNMGNESIFFLQAQPCQENRMASHH